MNLIIRNNSEYRNNIKDMRKFLLTSHLYIVGCSRHEVYSVYQKAASFVGSAIIICYTKDDKEFCIKNKENYKYLVADNFLRTDTIDELNNTTADTFFHSEYCVLFILSLESDINIYHKLLLLTNSLPYDYQRQNIMNANNMNTILFFKRVIKHNINKQEKSYIYLSPWQTYGDSIILYPILKHFVYSKEYKEYNLIHLNPVTKDILKQLLPEFRHILDNSNDVFENTLNILEGHGAIYSLCDFLSYDVLKENNKLHISQLIAKQLSIDNLDNALELVNNSYKMDDNSKAFIDDMREKYKYVISTISNADRLYGIRTSKDSDEKKLVKI